MTAFQFTLPRGERPTIGYPLLMTAVFQFTLPRGERPEVKSTAQADSGVSIHAPAWGATPYGGGLLLGEAVSIHAPAWGATRHATAHHHPPTGFNSRSRVGSDLSRRRSQ